MRCRALLKTLPRHVAAGGALTAFLTAAAVIAATPLYEYACHEGNYGLEQILSGARAGERAAEAVRNKR
jgi:hypothetical protein